MCLLGLWIITRNNRLRPNFFGCILSHDNLYWRNKVNKKIEPATAPTHPHEPGTVQSEDILRDMLMALNRPTAPYRIIDGAAENVDLIAEWKIVDAQWYEIFAKARLSKVFRIYMKLDADHHEVRAQDHEYTVQWSAGVPRLSLAVSAFRGQMTSVEFGAGYGSPGYHYAFTETLVPGQVYKYRFNTNEIKKPIQEVVAACGWRYKGISFGKL